MNFTKLPFSKQKQIDEGPVRTIDSSSLARPFDPPKPVLIVSLVFALIAAIIGGRYAFGAIDGILHGAQRDAATVETNINRGVSYDLPIMENYISLDDATIVQTFADAGYQTYNMLGEGEEGVDVMKIPSDVTLVDAALVYAKGVSSMDAVTASKYLVGSWRFTVSHTNGTEMKVRYCDLAAENAQDAVQHAWQSEGWADNGNVTITAEGVDEIGNTYREGTIETESGTHSWRISVCDLDGVYSISGLPSTAQYVGIRMN